MSEYTGYNGNSLEFLKTNKILVGDSVKICPLILTFD